MKVNKLFIATKAFIVHEDLVLLLQESSNYSDGTNEGKWDLPGGRMEPGEHYRDALKREVIEETGLEVSIEGPFYADEWFPLVRGEQWQIVGMFFLCTSKSRDVVLSKDHSSYKWVDIEETGSMQLNEATRQCFGEYIQKYRKGVRI